MRKSWNIKGADQTTRIRTTQSQISCRFRALSSLISAFVVRHLDIRNIVSLPFLARLEHDGEG